MAGRLRPKTAQHRNARSLLSQHGHYITAAYDFPRRFWLVENEAEVRHKFLMPPW